MGKVMTSPRRFARLRWGWVVVTFVILSAAGGGVRWRESNHNEEAKAAQTLNEMRARRDSNDRKMEMRISNVREQRSLDGMPQYYSSGDRWTIFDISPATGGDAPM